MDQDLRPINIAIVAGEVSGDILGSRLIKSLKQTYPNAKFIGIAGPQMIEAGCDALFPMERIAVMGVVEVLKHLPTILSIRRKLLRHLYQNPPEIFIGIDAPDFNLPIEAKLRKRGVKTVHYNSPTVWAWRKGRIHKIARSTNLMLTLLPFEAQFYEEHQVPVKFVGHPLADEIPLQPESNDVCKNLGLDSNKQVVTLMPGSRTSEIQHMAECFLQTAQLCLNELPELQFVIPVVRLAHQTLIEKINKDTAINIPLHFVQQDSRSAMTAADVILLASGTATLEATLLKKPMVVAYKVSRLSYEIGKRLIDVDHIALPNLLSGKRLVPEYIQHEATPEHLAPELIRRLSNQSMCEELKAEYSAIHKQLKQNASETAAMAIGELIEKT